MERLPPVVRGALWMTASMACFSAMNVTVRFLAESISPIEQVFLRSVAGFVIMLPILYRRGGMRNLGTARPGLHAVRALLTYLGVASWFYALTHMTLAGAVALHFTLPLFGVAMAAVVLRERLTPPRLIATGTGFVGVLVILRPGMVEIDLLALVVLFSAASYAGGDIALKALARTESPAFTVFMLNLLLIPMSLVPSLFYWTTPGWADAPGLLVMTVTGLGAHLCLARAFAAADASVVIPMEFVRLPLMAAAGYVFFAETPESWTLLGAAIIFGGIYYMTTKERRTPWRR